MARRAPAKRKDGRKRNPRVEVTLKKGGLTRELLLMTPKEQYDVLSAVRGPDSCMDGNQLGLKRCVTERLRSIAFSESSEFHGNYNNMPLTRADLDWVLYYLTSKPAGAEHFLSHLRLAMKATWWHKVWGSNGYDLMLAVSKATGF